MERSKSGRTDQEISDEADNRSDANQKPRGTANDGRNLNNSFSILKVYGSEATSQIMETSLTSSASRETVRRSSETWETTKSRVLTSMAPSIWATLAPTSLDPSCVYQQGFHGKHCGYGTSERNKNSWDKQSMNKGNKGMRRNKRNAPVTTNDGYKN